LEYHIGGNGVNAKRNESRKKRAEKAAFARRDGGRQVAKVLGLGDWTALVERVTDLAGEISRRVRLGEHGQALLPCLLKRGEARAVYL
jgi:DNA-binding MarR family transcriptional regulator